MEVQTTEGLEVFVYRGGFGLPSIDFDCLRTIAYIRFCKAPVKITTVSNPIKSPSGRLPYMTINGTKKTAGFQNIVHHLNDEGFNANESLTPQESGLSDAYIAHIFDAIYPALLYIMWGDPQNQDASRTLYAKRTPFPFNFYSPNKYLHLTRDCIEMFAGFSIEDKLENHEIMELLAVAQIALKTLVNKLGNKRFMLGDNVSELDAHIYAYIGVLWHLDLPNNPLNSHLREYCPTLTKYIKRLTETYMADLGHVEPGELKNKPDGISSLDLDAVATRKVKIVSACVAVGSMMAYALYKGIVQLSINDDYMIDAYMDDEDDVVDDDI